LFSHERNRVLRGNNTTNHAIPVRADWHTAIQQKTLRPHRGERFPSAIPPIFGDLRPTGHPHSSPLTVASGPPPRHAYAPTMRSQLPGGRARSERRAACSQWPALSVCTLSRALILLSAIRRIIAPARRKTMTAQTARTCPGGRPSGPVAAAPGQGLRLGADPPRELAERMETMPPLRTNNRAITRQRPRR
jgi:hypothetical protein